MTSGVVDTTLLTDATLKPAVAKKTRAFLAQYTTHLPEYGIREFCAGPLQYHVWLHNKLAETRSYAKTLEAISAVMRQKNRAATATNALAEDARKLSADFATLPQMEDGLSFDEYQANYYRVVERDKVSLAWRGRRKLVDAVSHELSCFTDGGPKLERGLLVMHSKCDRKSKCAAAEMLVARPERLKKVFEANRAIQPQKPEHQKRNQALRALVKDSQWKYELCRKLGDAVFSVLAPPATVVLTTNTTDHEPLASALGLTVAKP